MARMRGGRRGGVRGWTTAVVVLVSLIAASAAQAAPTTGELPYYKFEDDTINDRTVARVNVVSGDLVVRSTDLHIAGTGLDLQVDRYFNSLTATDPTDLGQGFTLGVGKDVRLDVLADGSVDLHGPSNYLVRFTRNATTGAFTTPPGVPGQLVKNADGTYTLTYDADGEQLRFSAAGQLTADQDTNGNKVSFAYTAAGLLSSITDTQGRVITVTSDGSGRITAITDPTGRKVQYAYGSGRLATFTDAAGKVTKYTYDGSGNLTRLTHPSGRVTDFTYDASRRVLSIKRLKDTQTGTSATTTFSYAATQTVVTDPNGHNTTYTIDTQARVSKITDALGHDKTLAYNSDFNVTDTSNALSHRTLATFVGRDQTGLEQPKSSPTSTATARWSMTYDGQHNPTAMTDPQGQTLNYAYDGRNLTTVKDKNQVVRSTLGYNGLPSAASCARVTIDTGPRGTIRCSKDGNGNETIYRYDAKGNLTSEEPPLPLAATTVTYDALSRVSSVTDGRGQKTTFKYDALDRATSATYADGSSVAFAYDPDGNMTSRTDGTGVSTFSFDTLNRLFKEQLPGSRTNTYTYDDAGNMLSLTDAGGIVRYAYDAVNNLKVLTDPGGAQTTFDYNNADARTATHYPNGVVQTQGYDDSDRLISIGATRGVTALTSFTYSYRDPATGADRNLVQSSTDMIVHTAGPTDTQHRTYKYDLLNRLTSVTSDDASRSYAYTYDAAGNILTGRGVTSTYNAANELTTRRSGQTQLTYDANGNLTKSDDVRQQQFGCSPGTTLHWANEVSYNAKNQMSSVTATRPWACAPKVDTFNFDYTGPNQFERVLAGAKSFTNNLLGLGNERDTDGLTTYVRDDDGRLISERTPAGTFYYLFDGHPGSVVSITDSAGDVRETYGYDPYGGKNIGSGSGLPIGTNPWQFASAYSDENETGYYKIGARYYDPDTMRWTQRDPLVGFVDPQQANGYAYAGDDPVNTTDPSGCAPIIALTVEPGPTFQHTVRIGHRLCTITHSYLRYRLVAITAFGSRTLATWLVPFRQNINCVRIPRDPGGITA